MALIAVAAPSTSAHSESGSLRVEFVKGGLFVGVGSGRGTLTHGGHDYPLHVSGLSVGATIGASKTYLVGRAYSFRTPSDIVGTYSAIGGGLAVAGGGGIVRLQNANGVVIELQGRKVDLELSANVSGVTISMR